jgi:hypothetical protein
MYEKIRIKLLGLRLKHLRGRHDQLDHAWNRGMGGGGGAAGADGAATGGLSKMMKYRETRAALLDMVRTGDMTRNEAREQLRAMRDTLGDMSPNRREEFAANRATGDIAGITQENAASKWISSSNTFSSNVFRGLTILSPLEDNAHSSAIDKYIGALMGYSAPDFPSLELALKSVTDAIVQNGGPTPRKSGGLSLRGFLPSSRISVTIESARQQIIEPSRVGRNEQAPNYTQLSEHSPSSDTDRKIKTLFNEHPDALKMYDEFDKEFGISTWRLDDNADDSEYTKAAIDAFKNLESAKTQLMTLVAETEAVATEYEAVYAIHNSLEISLGNMMTQLARYEAILNNPGAADALKQAAKMVADDMRQSIDALSMYEEVIASTLQSLEPVVLDYGKKINDQIAYAASQQLNYGQQIVSQSTLDFLQQHGGVSVNPNMQTGSYWNPSVEYTQIPRGIEAVAERQEKHNDIMQNVNDVLNLLVDARFRSTSNSANGPEKIEYDSYNKEQGSYVVNYDMMRAPEDFASTATILHEYMHFMNNTETGDSLLTQKLNGLILGFFKKRYDKSPTSYQSGGTKWTPDDFSDWYAGLLSEVLDPYPFEYTQSPKGMMDREFFPVELLSMGITFMLHNPVKFAKEQPDYFRFISVILSGAWIK